MEWRVMPFGWAPATLIAQSFSRFLGAVVRYVDVSKMGYPLFTGIEFGPCLISLTNIYIGNF